ncbi:phosphoserine phosphatase [Vibrio variabilis]|uniref:Phosphoserine phosphatase n=1 Tax=Vibrio variabilis TaxID=990271 RepID=A0ABQ0J6K3_9VIBR|nr:phosphoserine phosphatase [Vibrio variabilis]
MEPILGGKGIATAPDFLEEDKRLMALYAQGNMDMEDYLKFSMSPLSGVSKEAVSLLVEQCIDEKSCLVYFHKLPL